MQCRITDLRCKEIINICDGKRIGYAEDVDLVLPEGRVCAIIAYGKGRFFGLLRGEEYYIPWDCIKQIGDDLILVDKSFPRKAPLRSATAAGIFENSLSVAAPCGTIEPNLPESAEKRQKILANQFLL